MLEVSLALLLGVAVLVYLWVQRRHRYWSSKGLSQPPTVLGFGHVLDTVLMRSNIGLTNAKFYRSYSDKAAVGVYQFLEPKLLLRSPDLIQRVLVSDFSSFHDNEFKLNKRLEPYFNMDPFALKGDEWKHSRMKLVTTMTTARLKEIFPLMKSVGPRLLGYLEDHLEEDFDAKQLATLFTMDIVSNAVFGIESNCFSDEEAPFRKMGLVLSEEFQRNRWKLLIMFYFPTLRNILGLRLMPNKVINFVKQMVKDVVEFRRKTDFSGADMFQHYMKKEKVSDKGGASSIDHIIGFGATFFAEGFETSSMVASTVLYELAMNPAAQQALYEEVSVVFRKGADPDLVTIVNNLPYLDKVIQESQRIYPVGYEMVKECTRTICLEIDGKSIEIEKGTSVIIPIYALHHDPKYYPDPDVFNPERFNEYNKTERPVFTYLPFGEGPRMCPGLKFALIQIKLFIANLVLNYRVLRTEKTPPTLTLLTTTPLVNPVETKWIRLENRK